jgi:hypothetical protein
MLLYETQIGPAQTKQILAALGPPTMVHENSVFGRVWWIPRRVSATQAATRPVDAGRP